MKQSIRDGIIEMARALREHGHVPAEAMMTPATKTRLEDELNLPSLPRGVPTIDRLPTPYGDITILTSPYCPPDKIYVVEAGQMQRVHDDTAKLYER